MQTDKAQAKPKPIIVVILNADSGGAATGGSPAEIERHFDDLRPNARVHSMQAGDDKARVKSEAHDLGARCVVVAGGDGTLSGAVEALADYDVDLGIMPLGTFNFSHAVMRISQEVKLAIVVICIGEAHTFDIGSVYGRSFLRIASLGLYLAILGLSELTYRRQLINPSDIKP